jgi:endo-alpha-1,4-polygalactosaminidase (GH114 family)
MRSKSKRWLVFVTFLLMACSLVNLSEQEAMPSSSPSLKEPSTPGATAAVLDTPLSPTQTRTLQDSGNNWWKPLTGLRWQWQLSSLPIDLQVDVDLYDIDLFENDANIITALHAQGRKVVCYMSAGSWENWRPDQNQFTASLIGKDYKGWPGEKWLDIRQIDLLAPVMRARLDLCKKKGFDGIEPDNIDGYTNETGFPLTYADQIRYNLWLANEAHARGLSIGLKNDPDQVGDLLPSFDWALTEDCFAEGWCDQMKPFIQNGKPVFAAEYTDSGVEIKLLCQNTQKSDFSFILKNRKLDSWRQACP